MTKTTQNMLGRFYVTFKHYLHGESAFVKIKVRISLLWWSVGGSRCFAPCGARAGTPARPHSGRLARSLLDSPPDCLA